MQKNMTENKKNENQASTYVYNNMSMRKIYINIVMTVDNIPIRNSYN